MVMICSSHFVKPYKVLRSILSATTILFLNYIQIKIYELNHSAIINYKMEKTLSNKYIIT